ncbi:hypothetical protein [Massilia sp. TWP1-3-3]|uniref:hypothetical protein n=1 Tax=Massilia sp. TWP1-3-3 TaxID=2804573 RepID=UPI003CEB3CB3
MVNWLRSLFMPAPRLQLAPDALPVPWSAGRMAVHDRICTSETQSDGSLRNPSFPLFGERAPGATAWDGATDYSANDHRSAPARAQAHAVNTALHRAAGHHAAPHLDTLYQALLSAPDEMLAGDVLTRLDKTGADPARMALLARWLARKAPDAMPVKIAIAVLGRYGNASDADLLMTLGLHEAFTQLCAIALCQLLGPEQSQTAMWNLARRVRGWGRIHVVRKLAGTQCPEIQQWLLRDGYKNTRMSASLAYLCATGGNLLEALKAPAPDERLLLGAGEILQILCEGREGPDKTMADYADGAAATLAYLHCVQRQRPQQLQVAATVRAIAAMDSDGWDDAQLRHVRHLAGQVLAMDDWPALVRDKLRSGTDDQFELAAQLAPDFRVDPWDFHFAKQQRRERSQWFGLTSTTDPARVERYVALALEQLDLAAEQGPHDAETRSAINWLAIGLRKFSGKGWPILRAALSGDDRANKSNAVDTLARWRSVHWHAQAEDVLERAWCSEAQGELKQQMEALLEKTAGARTRSGA